MDVPNRRSIRWRGFDYCTPGAYFVTMCVQGRRPLLGSIEAGRVHLSPGGAAVDAGWFALQHRFGHVALDVHVVMPDHLHGVLHLVEGDGTRVPLGEIVRWFKSETTRAWIRGVRREGWPRFHRRLWQRGFYERVLRDEDELARARSYTTLNPAIWWKRRGREGGDGLLPTGDDTGGADP